MAMSFFKNNKTSIKIFLEILLLCFLTLSIKSNNSFLYGFNMWDDPNAFLTVGRSMLDGKVIYRDIFEQKGPLFYFIYMIGALISPNNFYGVFLLEVVFAAVGVWFSHKIVKLYVKNDKKALIISLIFGILVTSSNAIVMGGTTEEFCFPLFMISIYYFFRYLKSGEMSYKQFRLVGFVAGCILLIKFNLLGMWFGFMATYFFEKICSKKYKEAILNSVNFLLGMAVPFIVTNVYMWVNNALFEFYGAYFFCNIKLYTSSYCEDFWYIIRFILAVLGSFVNSGAALILTLLCMWPWILAKLSKSKKENVYFGIMVIFTLFGIFAGIRTYPYYSLPLLYVFIIPITLVLDILISEKSVDSFRIKHQIFVAIAALLIIFRMDFYNQFFLVPKDEILLKEYADIINQEENPTLVNMGGLDVGLYLFADVLPSTYFFELQNYSYEKFPYIIDSFKKYIANKETMFIVFFTFDDLDEIYNEYTELNKNYNLIKKDEYDEYFGKKIYLFKVKS